MTRSVRWLGILLLTACSSADRPTRPQFGPEFAISDAVHEGGTPGFYFLPPMVAQPTFNGTFDADIATLSPQIAICDVSNDGNCGSSSATLLVFTTTSTPAITVDASTPQYQVNWNTQANGFVAGHTYRVHLVAGASGARRELGFADVLLTTTPGQAQRVETGDIIVLQDGRTLPIHVRIERGIPGSLAVSAATSSVASGGTDVITATVEDLHGALLVGASLAWSVTTTPATGVADATQPLNPTSGQTGTAGTTATTFKAGTGVGRAMVTAATAGLSAMVTVNVTNTVPAFQEFPVPTAGSVPFGITAGPDGALWFTEQVGKIGRITTAGVITEFTVPRAGSVTLNIAAGPDGALWFVEQASNAIGRISPAGVITEFAIPTANSGPNSITAGADGALWFTEQFANQIGRVTTAGGITEFVIPTAASRPLGIALGPDGALWFAEFNGNQIGRITGGGAITELVLPTAGRGPFSIAAGSDGALWFTEAAPLDGAAVPHGSTIGRITTGGVVTEFTTPTGSSGPFGITAGPDGALWFTEYPANQIGRITTDGVITEFTVPTAGSGPSAITTGPDGALWFNESGGNKVGRIAPRGGSITLTKGWDIFSDPGAGTVAWTIPAPRQLVVTYTVSGAEPNHTYAAGIHLFNGTSATPPSINFAGTFIGEGSIVRENIGPVFVVAWDFGPLTTDANGNGSAQFALAPPSGTYYAQFTVRKGICPAYPQGSTNDCAAVYRAPSPFSLNRLTIPIP
jgi:virginiamycin B lyase